MTDAERFGGEFLNRSERRRLGQAQRPVPPRVQRILDAVNAKVIDKADIIDQADDFSILVFPKGNGFEVKVKLTA